MSILVLSSDDDAARSLCSALTRTGQIALWERVPDRAQAVADDRQPLVLVADTSVDGHTQVIDRVRDATPWARIYLMADPAAPFPRALAPVVQKPFDAAELAALLVREQELAELERGRRSLQAHVDELAILVEASFEAIIGLGPDGVIRSWNRGAAATYGYQTEEILGRPISLLETDTPGPENGSGNGRAEVSARATGRAVTERTRRRKDGKIIRVLLSRSPISGRDSSLGFAEVSLDVTERKELERELEHAERLAEIGRIAASMAHEINNPLAVIRASTSYVLEVAERLADSELLESARDMELASERIGSFVQHVCGFARRERPHLTDASVRATIDIALRMAKPRARDRNVDLVVEPGGDAFAPHDPPRLAQAILNVAANAVDAAAERGRTVAIRLAEDAGQVVIEVDDTGRGLADGIDVFAPFITTKPSGQGTGLGLAITRQILDDHSGTVSLAPREGGGTRAKLTIPKADISGQPVLVLDADPALRRALCTELRRAGFRVEGTETLQEAAGPLDGEAPRVVLTDVRRDESDENVVDLIRAAYPETRVLVVSADPRRLEVGADSSVSIPWDRADLIAAVRRLYIG